MLGNDRWRQGNRKFVGTVVTLKTGRKLDGRDNKLSGKETMERGSKQFGVEASRNVMAHAQKPDFVFRPNGRVHLNRRGRQFSWLLAAEVGASAVVMLDTPCSEVVWRVLATHSIRQFPLHFPAPASLCTITFQLESTNWTKEEMCEGGNEGTGMPIEWFNKREGKINKGGAK
jgi:hypothetical protein